MDEFIVSALQNIRFTGLTELMALFSALGQMGFVWFFVAATMLVPSRSRMAGLTVALSVVVCDLLVPLALAPLFARIDPAQAHIGVTAVTGVSHAGYCFPSIHAATSVAAVVAAGLLRGKVGAVPCSLLALVIMFSRLFCGVNYLTDLLAGAVVGALVAVVLSLLANQLPYSSGGSSRRSTRPSGSSKVSPRR